MNEDRFFKEIVDDVKVKNPNITNTTLHSHDLPSQGLFYPSNTTINYRLFTFGELKILTNKTLDLNNLESLKDKFDVYLKGITVNPNFDKYDLCYYDFLYISILRKYPSLAKDISEPLALTATCNNCETINLIDLDLTNIEFNDLSSKVDVSYKDFKFKPITIKKYLELIDFHNREKNLDDDIANLAACLDNELSIDENYNVIFNIADRETIYKIFEIENNLKLNIKPYKHVCSKCSYDMYIRLDTSDTAYHICLPRLL